MSKQARSVFGMVFLFLLPLSLTVGAIPFAESFDAAALDQFPAGWEDGGDIKAVCTVVDKTVMAPHTPPHCLKMADDSPGGAAQASRWFGKQERGSIRFAFLNPSSGAGDFYCTFTKDGERVVDISLSGNGNVKYRDQEGVLQDCGVKYERDAWHMVTVAWDVATGKFAYTVDDKKIGDFPMIKSIAPDRVVFKLGSSNKVEMSGYLDSIELKAE
ncbi:MAG: hypothetical protein ACM3ZC_00650 [Bacteroidota bacterium]